MSDKEKPESESKEKTIKIEVDRSKEIDELQRELKKISEEAKVEKERAEKLTKEKADIEKAKTDVEQEKTNLQTEKEDLESKLTAIAEKEYTAKKGVMMERVKSVFPADEARIKEIEGRLSDPEKGPENLKQTEYMIGVLEENIRKGQEAAQKTQKEAEEKAKAEAEKKAAEAKAGQTPPPTGGTTATLSQEQITGKPAGEVKKPTGTVAGEYDSVDAMISDLRARARNTKDPAGQAEAEAILKELFKKWGKAVKKDYESGRPKGGASEVDYDEEKHGESTEASKLGKGV